MILADLSRTLAARFEAGGIPGNEARLDAELLLRSLLSWDRAQWIVGRGEEAPPGLLQRLEPLAARRAAREPIAYVLGRREFWGREFEVGPGVLIPRPETELVVEQALARVGDENALAVDVGTGSGCLAVTLALERPRLRVIATDISGPALEIARRNAQRHGVDGRIDFRHAPFLAGVGDGTAAIVVSNPPYVPAGDRGRLTPEVAAHEPSDALYGGEDGLDVVRGLAAAGRHVVPCGWLIFEIGYGQERPAYELMVAAALWPGGPPAWEDITIVRDLQGIPRTVVARRRHERTR